MERSWVGDVLRRYVPAARKKEFWLGWGAAMTYMLIASVLSMLALMAIPWEYIARLVEYLTSILGQVWGYVTLAVSVLAGSAIVIATALLLVEVMRVARRELTRLWKKTYPKIDKLVLRLLPAKVRKSILKRRKRKMAKQSLISRFLPQNPTLKEFTQHPEISGYDRILFILLGGGGGVGRVLKAMFKRYPELEQFIKVWVVDFTLEDRDVDPRWGVYLLGQSDGLDDRLDAVVGRHGIPEDKFTPDELVQLKLFIQEHGHHQFAHGAGMNPLVGRLGYLYVEDELRVWIDAEFKRMRDSYNVDRMLPVVAAGAAGGTGWGVLPHFIPMVTAVGHEVGITGASGIATAVLGWRAYTRIIFQHMGEETALAELFWERSLRAWNTARNCFFITTEYGPDSMLAFLMVVAEKIKVLNNTSLGDSEKRAHANALLQFEEVTPWQLQRIAGFLIQRGQAPVKPKALWRLERKGMLGNSHHAILNINVDKLTTVQELMEAKHLLKAQQCRLALDATLKAHNKGKGLEKMHVLNYTARSGDVPSVDDQINAQLARIRELTTRLRRLAGATGLFLMPYERHLVDHVRDLKLADLQRGTATVVVDHEVIPPMVLGQPMVSELIGVGASQCLFEIGMRKNGVDDNITIPPYKSISPEEAAAIETAARLEAAKQRQTASAW